MKIRYQHITLFYSTPKYVVVILECACSRCGKRVTVTLDCYKYGRINVGCTICLTTEILVLDRKVVRDFHVHAFPHLIGSLDSFLDNWEKDMEKNK